MQTTILNTGSTSLFDLSFINSEAIKQLRSTLNYTGIITTGKSGKNYNWQKLSSAMGFGKVENDDIRHHFRDLCEKHPISTKVWNDFLELDETEGIEWIGKNKALFEPFYKGIFIGTVCEGNHKHSVVILDLDFIVENSTGEKVANQ